MQGNESASEYVQRIENEMVMRARLDLYVTHAPPHAPGDFKPVIEPRPEPYWTNEEHKKANHPAHNAKEIAEWENRREWERLFQWPIYWAEQMIKRVDYHLHEPHPAAIAIRAAHSGQIIDTGR